MLKKWIDHEFESSSETTPEFAAFARDCRKFVVSQLPEGSELASFDRGHFECGGFVKMGERFVWFKVRDVRDLDWSEKILLRTAKHAKDYQGGRNWFATVRNFGPLVKQLLKEDINVASH